jgi:hypothetical protein
MSVELIPQYLRSFWSQNKDKEANKKDPYNEISKTCFFQKNLKFMEDFKTKFIHQSINHNLYQLIIDICTYVNNKKNYSYDYIIYDINSFFDLYNKNLSVIDNDYLITFINNIKNNFCLNKELIDKINSIILNFESDNYLENTEINITSPDFEEDAFKFENFYFKNNIEFKDNLEIEDVEYNNCFSDDEY